MMLAVQWTLSLTLSSLLVFSCAIEPGLEVVRPSPGSKSECLDPELTFRCTTTGKGDTELMFEAISVHVPAFQFRHGLYTPDIPNQNDNKSRLNGELRAGNLSRRSDSDKCFNSQHNTTDCYTTSLVVYITNRTMCGIVVCSTIYRPDNESDEITLYGKEFIARVPPQPASLNVTTPSWESLTFTWEAGTTVNCSTITYEVTTTSKCGDCPLNWTTSNNFIICKDLTAGQWCNVSVRSMLECGVYSNFTMLPVQVPEATPATKDNDGAALGIGLGVSLPTVIVVAIVGIAICVYFVKRRSKSNDIEHEHGTIPTLDDHETIDPDDPVGDPDVSQQQLLPPPDPDQSITHEAKTETNENQTSLTNGVATATEQSPSDDSKECEELDSEKGGGTNTDALQSPVLSTEQSVKVAEPAALVPGLETVGIPSQHENTNATSFRDVPMTMVPSLQTFSTSVEDGKKSASAVATSSLVTEGECLVPDNGHEPPKPRYNLSEGGMLLSQELTRNDSEGEVAAKKPVALSDSENGPSQAIGINGKGAQNFTNIVGNGSGDVPDVVSRFDKRITDLETNQREAKKEREELKGQAQREKEEHQATIDKLTAEISDLRKQLETVRANYEKESEAERQRHKEEEDKLKERIGKLEQQLETARKRITELEEENTTLRIPKKSLSTKASVSDAKPELQRTKSCPADS